MRHPLPLFAALLTLPIVACAAESSPTADRALNDDGGQEADAGVATGWSDAGTPSPGPTDAVGKLVPGVLFVHGSYTLPALRFCLSDDQNRAEPSQEQMAAGNTVGVDVTTARFVPGDRFSAKAASATEVIAYDALAVAALERTKGGLTCAELKSTIDAKSRYALPVYTGADTKGGLGDPTEAPIVIAAEGCETLGDDSFKAKGGRCASPFRQVRGTVGGSDRANAHIATFPLPGMVSGAVVVHAASGTSYIGTDGLSTSVPATVTLKGESSVESTLSFGQAATIGLTPKSLESETYTLTVTAERGTQAKINEGATAEDARKFVDPRSTAQTYYSDTNRRIAFVLVGASVQRDNGPPVSDEAPSPERKLQFAAVSIPIVTPTQSQ